uniref:Anoctamin n=1 Tax=Parastrongyloides trichosuri TaxID=131310 RepID=A0A0N4ZU72_PARTI
MNGEDVASKKKDSENSNSGSSTKGSISERTKKQSSKKLINTNTLREGLEIVSADKTNALDIQKKPKEYKIKKYISEIANKIYNWRFNKNNLITQTVIKEKNIKLLELDEAGNVVIENFNKKINELRKNEMINYKIFDKESTNRYLKELLQFYKAIPASNIIYEIEKSLRRGEQLKFTEIPQLYSDREVLLYTNLIQPSCPDISPDFKLKDHVTDYIESSTIEAKNALKINDTEFKGFWTAFACLFLTLINYQTGVIIPIMAYEYGDQLLIYIFFVQIIFIFPLMLFLMSLSQYTGLGSAQLYSSIKKVWRGIEYFVLMRTFYTIVHLIQEIQFAAQTLYMGIQSLSNNNDYLQTCVDRDDGCVNIRFIHPCSTGYQLAINNNEYCRNINQVSSDKYRTKKTYTKMLSMIQYMYRLSERVS